jgi:glycosyltransferase involved in cell wall biosynthesis
MSSQIKNKKIALITTWYPPINGIAVNRMNAFANYLSEKFEVEVFCLGKQNETVSLNSNLKVHYTPSNRLFELLKSNTKDNKIVHNGKTALRVLLKKIVSNPLNSWKNQTLNKLKKRHSDNKFDLIISSYSPEESHLVAIEFCKIYGDVKWIADMRDEMSSNPYISLALKNSLKQIESEVNTYASAILSVSKPILDEFRLICPDVHYFEEIRNGFDHELVFENTELSPDKVFNLGYFGSFYGSRKPDFVLESLAVLKNEYPDYCFHFHIYGAHNNYSIPSILKDNIFKHQGLPYLEAIIEMNKMDANILIHPRSKHKGVFSGKIFDYISAKKTVLAFVDKDDVAADLIREYNCGYVAEFDILSENKQILLNAFEDKMKGEFKIASDADILKLHRTNQINILSELIIKLTI